MIWVQGICARSCVIQKRVAYFDCTVALGDSCAALSHAALPSSSLPASLVQPRWYRAMVGVAEWHKSFVDLILASTIVHLRSR